jgi:hypothetical protein
MRLRGLLNPASCSGTLLCTDVKLDIGAVRIRVFSSPPFLRELEGREEY